MEKKLFDILKERGYVKDLTHEQEIIDLVNGEPMTFYLGIDPTADSLHIGHFFALTMFRWLQDFGHHGIILIGGATALIGDPTGKSKTSFDVIVGLCDHLDVTPDYLFMGFMHSNNISKDLEDLIRTLPDKKKELLYLIAIVLRDN